MNRCVHIIFNKLLTDNDGIFEIESIPRHEANENIPTQGQFAFKRGSAISDNFILLNLLAKLNNRLLILAGSFIQSDVFSQLVNIGFVYLNRICINVGDRSLTFGTNEQARVGCDISLHACCHDRRFGHKQWHCLTLHV